MQIKSNVETEHIIVITKCLSSATIDKKFPQDILSENTNLADDTGFLAVVQLERLVTTQMRSNINATCRTCGCACAHAADAGRLLRG